MPHELCVVESPSLAPQLSVSRLLTLEAGFHCRYDNWNSFSLRELSGLDSKLLLAVAVPESKEAMQFFQSLLANGHRIPTLAVLPNEPSEELLRTASQTADDFIFWPVRQPELRQRVNRLLGTNQNAIEAAQRMLTGELGLAQLVGSAPAFLDVIGQIVRMAPSEAPVLITGETGTGKEVCARSVHLLGRLRQGPFIPVECSAIPEHLAESELFGHVRGAFTDAHRDHKGLVSLADGGTLFLDEIDSLSLPLQAKFLRFIQEGTYRPVGAERFVQANVRIIAASNQNLEGCVRHKEFRNDLYFRLNVLRLLLPSLRERRQDISLLAQHFLDTRAQVEQAVRKQLSPAALGRLEAHDWPGNVRELLNVMQRAVVLAPGNQILPCHIVLSTGRFEEAEGVINFRRARLRVIATFEQQYVHEMLRKHQGNITHAALDAGQDRRAFGRLVKKYKAS